MHSPGKPSIQKLRAGKSLRGLKISTNPPFSKVKSIYGRSTRLTRSYVSRGERSKRDTEFLLRHPVASVAVQLRIRRNWR